MPTLLLKDLYSGETPAMLNKANKGERRNLKMNSYHWWSKLNSSVLFLPLIVLLLSACALPIKPSMDNIQVESNRELWVRTSDFNNSTTDDKHYVIRNDNGATIIIFGDGIHGAIPESGNNAIKVTYTYGGGASGSLEPQEYIQYYDRCKKINSGLCHLLLVFTK